jgi:hypothetical protein
MGVYVWECTRICCANIVLGALFRNGDPQSGTVFVYHNNSSKQNAHNCHAKLYEAVGAHGLVD